MPDDREQVPPVGALGVGALGVDLADHALQREVGFRFWAVTG